MPGHNSNRGSIVTMSNRNTRVRWHCDGRTNTRDYLKGNACGGQRLDLFATASEDIGISALQAHHNAALLGIGNQQRIDISLLQAMVLRPLTHRYAHG